MNKKQARKGRKQVSTPMEERTHLAWLKRCHKMLDRSMRTGLKELFRKLERRYPNTPAGRARLDRDCLGTKTRRRRIEKKKGVKQRDPVSEVVRTVRSADETIKREAKEYAEKRLRGEKAFAEAAEAMIPRNKKRQRKVKK